MFGTLSTRRLFPRPSPIPKQVCSHCRAARSEFCEAPSAGGVPQDEPLRRELGETREQHHRRTLARSHSGSRADRDCRVESERRKCQGTSVNGTLHFSLTTIGYSLAIVQVRQVCDSRAISTKIVQKFLNEKGGVCMQIRRRQYIVVLSHRSCLSMPLMIITA